MTKPIDMAELRRAIEAPGGALVDRAWLEQVERELKDGRAAKAELARMKGTAAVIDSIAGSAR
ncbi:MAG: hypothetical protein M3N07_10045 [Pseudomonadota bacterium]|nr:hypothetical protein [Pseudomonadota bacterium]